MRGLRVFLDNSLEVVIAYARVQAVLSLLGAFYGIGCWIWSGDTRFGGLAALAFALAWTCAWFGFWLYGNEEWKRGGTVRKATGVRDN